MICEAMFINKPAEKTYSILLDCPSTVHHEEVERLGREAINKIDRFIGVDIGTYRGYRARHECLEWEEYPA